MLVGFLPGRTGVAGAALLGDEGIVVRGVEVGGELRSTAVVLERSGRVTVFNEPGPALAPGDWERYEGAVADALRGRSACWRAAGRCRRARPPTPTRGWSASRTGAARWRSSTSAASSWRRRWRAGADVVTPNLAEAEGLLHGRADETVEAGDVGWCASARVAAARALVERGAARAVVTAAEAGAAVADGWLARWVAAPAVAEVRNPIGAGDALVGGLALALERGEEFAAAVALGMACGAASVETDVAGVVVPERVAALLASACCVTSAALALRITEGKRPRGGAAVGGRPPRGELPEGCWILGLLAPKSSTVVNSCSPATAIDHAAPGRARAAAGSLPSMMLLAPRGAGDGGGDTGAPHRS